jgi:[ribosomal protein S5]-alanine N-acetyltransferase
MPPLEASKLNLETWDTARLTAARIRESNLEEMVRMHRDARVMATLGGLRTDHETRRMLTVFTRHWDEHGFGVWIFRSKAGREFVGRCGLRIGEVARRREVEMMWAVMPDFWRQGMATEMARAVARIAFRSLDIPDLVAFTLPENRASRRVMEKSGFTYEREIEWKGLRHVLYRLRRDAFFETGIQ